MENGEVIIIDEIINYIFEFFCEYGLNVWFECDVKDLLFVGFMYLGSLNGEFIKEIDIMDVWFDLGFSY